MKASIFSTALSRNTALTLSRNTGLDLLNCPIQTFLPPSNSIYNTPHFPSLIGIHARTGFI